MLWSILREASAIYLVHNDQTDGKYADLTRLLPVASDKPDGPAHV